MFLMHCTNGEWWLVIDCSVFTATDDLQSPFPSTAAAYQLEGPQESFHPLPPQEMVAYNPGPYTGPYTGELLCLNVHKLGCLSSCLGGSVGRALD